MGGPVILLLAAVLVSVFCRMQPTTGPRLETYPAPKHF